MHKIGWKEWVCLPELGLKSVKAKIDTGARTSALHTFEIEPKTRRGRDYIRFRIHPLQHNNELVVEHEALIKDRRIVRDSGGHEEERYVIETPLQIGDLQFPIELTLTNREDMLFRMLLGRTALKAGKLMVNPAATYLSGKRFKPARKPR
ncbi:MAG: ATP-dependent zinc protease [Gammaproteobacteria bacterium]